MKFSKVLALEQVEQWKDRYVNFYFLKQCIRHHVKILGVALDEEALDLGNTKAVDSISLRKTSKSAKKLLKQEYGPFETELANEVGKVEAFFRSRQDKFASRLHELNTEIELMKSGTAASTRSADALRAAYHDNYVHWKLLRKFQETNKFGFVKILKKYDKDFNENKFEYFLETYLQSTSFWNPNVIQDMIAETKEVYTKYFAASDERLAKSQLRKSDPKRRESSLFFVALFFGTVVSLFVVCVYSFTMHYPALPPSFASVGWFIYRISLLPIELGIFFSLSAYIWEKYNINYVFIFRFNPAHYRSPLMYLKYGLCALTLWTISFYFFMDAVIYNIRAFYGLVSPLLFVIIVAIVFFLPLPVLGYRTRFFLIKKLSRVLRAGLPGKINVSFADFIMAIHLIALSEFFLDFQIVFCMFGVRDNTVCQDNVYALPILSAVPHWCRMCQCIRRWRQTGQAYPHLASAIRPASTLLTLVLSEVANTYTDRRWILAVWLTCNIFFSSVRWYSDILIDFGFVKPGLDFSLRKQRLYPTWVYYFVMADNFLLRHVWLIVYMLRKHTSLDMSEPVLLLFLSSFDVVWGFQFVFFRMENEHFNCSDRYNIIQDVPLPFTKKYEALARKNALKSQKREQKSSTISDAFRRIKRSWFTMPWVDKRKKLRKSITKAILEVERDHPNLQNSPMRQVTTTPHTSSRNLNQSGTFAVALNQSSGSIPMGTYSYSVNSQSGLISTPFAMRTNPSTASINYNYALSHPYPLHSLSRSSSSTNVLPAPSTASASPHHSRAQSPVHTPMRSTTQTPAHSPFPSPAPSATASPHHSPYPSPPPSPRSAPLSHLPLPDHFPPPPSLSQPSTPSHPLEPSPPDSSL